MFVDYHFYKNTFGGTALTEEEFQRFGDLACAYVSDNTLSRITDDKINLFPQEVQLRAKKCACALAENFKTCDYFSKLASGQIEGQSGGIVRSKTAGAVSVTYETSVSAQYFLDVKTQENLKQSILRSYLSPVCIDGKMYNPLSKVI